jgi:hypothetical protein
MNKKPTRSKKENKIIYQRKLAMGLLIFLGATTLFFGFLKIISDIRSPFVRSGISDGSPTTNLSELSGQLGGTQAELQNKDTDQDGLSDWQELNLYGTSPYLPDSDADGYDDRTEVISNNDPNCPAGQECRGVISLPEIDTGIDLGLPLLDEDTINQELGVEPGDGAALPDELAGELEALAPAQIRQLLLESGAIDEETLKQIDDDTLLEVYREVLSGQEGQ